VSGSLSHASSALPSFPASRAGSFPGSVAASRAASQSASPMHRPNKPQQPVAAAQQQPGVQTAAVTDATAGDSGEIKPGTGSLATPFPFPSFPLPTGSSGSGSGSGAYASAAGTPQAGGGGAMALGRSPFSFLQQQNQHQQPPPYSGNATPPSSGVAPSSGASSAASSRPPSAAGSHPWLGVPAASLSRPSTSGGSVSGSGAQPSPLGLALSVPSSAGPSPLPSPHAGSGGIFAGGPSFGASSGGVSAANSTPATSAASSPFNALHFTKGMHAPSSGPVTASALHSQLKAQPVRSASAVATTAGTPSAAASLPTRSNSTGSSLLPQPQVRSIGSVSLTPQQPLPPRIPPYPATLRASSCSVLGSMLAPPSTSAPSAIATAPVAGPALTPFIVTPAAVPVSSSKPALASAAPAALIDDSLAALMSRMTFTLSSLLSDAVALAAREGAAGAANGVLLSPSSDSNDVSRFDAAATALVPFAFAEPSPDDLARTRLQAAGAPQRGVTTDAPSLEAREAKAAAQLVGGGSKVKGQRKKALQQQQQRLAELDAHDAGEGGFVHAGPHSQLSRAAIAASIGSLSSASVGAGTSGSGGALRDADDIFGLADDGVSPLLRSSMSLLRSRLFLALDKAVLGHKRAVMDEVSRGAAVAAAMMQVRTRAPREREREQIADGAADAASASVAEGAAAGASGAAPAIGVSGSLAPVRLLAEEPFSSKAGALVLLQGSSASASAASSAAPAQVGALQAALRRARLEGASSTLELLGSGEDGAPNAGSAMTPSVRQLYERKVAAFSQGRALSSLSDAPLELRTPTAFPSFLLGGSGRASSSSPASLRLLVLGATPRAGVSTLLGQMLYMAGRLPFSLFRTRDCPPNYWEVFHGQHRVPPGVSSEVHASFLPPEIAAFIHAHPKLHARNSRRYDFTRYAHKVYTDRYRVEVMHGNMGNMHAPGKLYPFKPLSASSASASAGVSAAKQAAASAAAAAASAASFVPPPAQQQSLSLLAALQCDAIMLVVDGSPGAGGSGVAPSAEVVSSLLVAQAMGVKHVLVAVSQMDSGSGSARFSEKRFQATLASLVSSLLKPLGFAPGNIAAVPVSGLTGENLVRRAAKDLCGWYEGPTLLQALDKIVKPADRQGDAIADRNVVALVTEAPGPAGSSSDDFSNSGSTDPPQSVGLKRHMLNDSLISAMTVRVSVLSGCLLAGEPVSIASTGASGTSGGMGAPGTTVASMAPLGPLHVAAVTRELEQDPRDWAVYEDEPDENAAAQAQSSASIAAEEAAKASAAAAALAKAKAAALASGSGAAGKGKLSHAEKKSVLAEAKKAHAREQAKRSKQDKQGQADWKAQQDEWVRKAMEEEEAEAQAAAQAEAEAAKAKAAAAEEEEEAQRAVEAAAHAKSAAFAAGASSLASSRSVLHSSPCLLEGDSSCLVTLAPLPPPPRCADDDLSNLLSGRNIGDDLLAHSEAVLQHLAARGVRKGDILVLPLPGTEGQQQQQAGAGLFGGGVKFATSFRAEVLALPSWDESVRLTVGQVVTLVPLGRQGLPHPASVGYNSPASLLNMLSAAAAASAGAGEQGALPLGSAKVLVERLVSVLHKGTHAAARKRLEFLCGPPSAADASASSSLSTGPPDVSVVEFSCRPMALDSFAAGGARLGAFLLVHQDSVLALVTVTNVLAQV